MIGKITSPLMLLAFAGLLVCNDTPVASAQTEDVGSKWISITSEDPIVPLQDYLNRVRKAAGVTVLLDHRIDPHTPIKIPATQSGTLAALLAENLKQIKEPIVVNEIGDALLLIPKEAEYQLKTLVALRMDEFRERIADLPAAAQSREANRINRKKDREWGFLSTPQEVIQQVAQESSLEVDALELVPHDLWRAGGLPGTNTLELISWVLFQYDLTFQYVSANEIKIVPITHPVQIEKLHKLSAAQLEAFQQRITKEFPAATVAKQGRSQLRVAGPVELHDAIQQWKSGRDDKSTAKAPEWTQRRYTMEVADKTLREVLLFLKQSSLPLEADFDRIQQSGVDLDQKIQFKTDNADAEELMKAICGPLRIPYRVDENGVTVMPQD